MSSVLKIKDPNTGNWISILTIKGDPGDPGKSAYQSYLDTTDDDPVLSETEWASIYDTKENVGVAQSLVEQLIDGATSEGNTLKRLEDRLRAAEAIIGNVAGDDNNIIDTVRELLAVFSNFPEGSDMATLLTAKVNITDIYNALDCVIEGKALDARQGKVLSDAITALQTVVAGKADKTYTDTELALKELKANKQDSLTVDGTGTKFPTVDAVNAGLLLKENKQLIADYTHNSNIVLPQIESIDYSTSTITFTAPHGYTVVPNFYAHVVLININDYTIKTNYKAIPSGMYNYFTNIAEIISPTVIRFSNSVDKSNKSILNAEPSLVDFTKWHLEVGSGRVDIIIENSQAVEVVMLVNTSHSYNYVNISGNETSVDTVQEFGGNILGIGNAVIKRTFFLLGNGLVSTNAHGYGKSIKATGLVDYSYSLSNIWKYVGITHINKVYYYSQSHPMFCNGTRLLVYKLA